MKYLKERKTEPNVKAHREILNTCEEHGFRKDNTSMLTLLLPPGNEHRENKLLDLVESLLQPTGKNYVACVEPVLGHTITYKDTGYHEYRDSLPWYHVHILIQENGTELRSLKNQWYSLVGQSRQRLFHCSHLKESLSTAINYMVKFLEKKRPGTTVYQLNMQKEEVQLAESDLQLNVSTEPTAELSLKTIFSWIHSKKRKIMMKVTSMSRSLKKALLNSVQNLE